MRFYGRGIVWDKENNKSLCSFTDGELETSDDRIIKILTELGYTSNEKKELPEDTADLGKIIDQEKSKKKKK